MESMTVGVVKETTPGERRVALVPDAVARLRDRGMRVLLESGAGAAATFADSAYARAGAMVTAAPDVCAQADLVACVAPPDGATLRDGQAILGLLERAARPDLIRDWAGTGVTAISLDRLPRTLSRARPMDALTSQANVVGYKAVLVAASAYGEYLPMLVTPAETVRPAAVLVLGAGAVGLQAIATARRFGAIVTGYDIRPGTCDEVLALGARFLDPGGPLTTAELDERIAGFDIVITAAAVPGRRPPLLVTETALKGMRPGSVLVDTMCGPLGGNVALSRPDTAVVVGDGVTVIGAANLPAKMPAAASAAYARAIVAALRYFLRDGTLAIDTGDELVSATLLCHGGTLLAPPDSGGARLLRSPED